GLGYLLPNYKILSLLETVDLPAIRQVCPVTTIVGGLGGEYPQKLNTSSILRLPKVRDFFAQNGRVNLFVYKAATPLDPIVVELGVRLLSTPGAKSGPQQID
ncbi:MAG: hypothetical protein U1C50_00660, partial [Patescibacteria group bacterium]|nr:hypothetical protein [Patescibacteria group bacterium]